MEEKRPLVWLSAAPALPPQLACLRRHWQVQPVPFGASAPGAMPTPCPRIGLLDLSPISDLEDSRFPEQLESLSIRYWVALVRPEQVSIPAISSLIQHYCQDYHTLPIDPPRLDAVLGHLWGMASLTDAEVNEHAHSYQTCALEGRASVIVQARSLLRRFAITDEPVLIYGENGTGKEAAARFLHRHSRRARQPLVCVNCAALPQSLSQSELFGYEKGAFTHALNRRKGRLEVADGGTLLLLGVEELSLEQQSLLLRFLQEGQIERLGGSRPIRVDVRIVATSRAPLDQLVRQERFRSDVFYRLGSLVVQLPVLRERREDIPLLANRILAVSPCPNGRRQLSDDALVELARHHWPGNLRELQNRLRQSLLLSEGTLIQPADLGFRAAPSGNLPASLSLESFRARADRQAISACLALTHHNVTAAARLLRISRVSLYRLMDKHHIDHGHRAPNATGLKGEAQ